MNCRKNIIGKWLSTKRGSWFHVCTNHTVIVYHPRQSGKKIASLLTVLKKVFENDA